jgi:hypothetical protein
MVDWEDFLHHWACAMVFISRQTVSALSFITAREMFESIDVTNHNGAINIITAETAIIEQGLTLRCTDY